MNEEEERLSILRKFGFIVENSTEAILIGVGTFDMSEVPLDPDSILEYVAKSVKSKSFSDGYDHGLMFAKSFFGGDS